MPANGDTVIVPAGVSVLIDTDIDLGTDNIYLKVYGLLELDGGKLAVGANSTILLVGGGRITSAGNSSEQIRIGGVLKYKGSEGAIVGAAFANSSTGSSPDGFTKQGMGILPVSFAGFNVARQNNAILIDWSTASESNSQYFEVQRSTDGTNWMTLSTVTAAGTSASLKSYAYTDRSATAPVLYYRIRQVDMDGRYLTTAIRTIKMTDTDTRVKIAAGSNNSLYLHFSATVKGTVSVKVLSLSGQVVSQSLLSNPVGQQLIAVNSNLKGMYMVMVTDGNGFQQAAQVIL
jgi:hypothetical protein